MSLFDRIFRRNRRFDDISVSIQEHIDERTDELVEDGMPHKQAEQAARREFGNVALLKERSREVWQWQQLESLWIDLKHVFRRLKRAPGFAVTVILTLAIGIGANTAVFSVLNSILLRPLSYPHPEQLIALRLKAPGAEGLADFRDDLRLSASMYFTFARHNQTFQSIGVWSTGTASVTGFAQPEQVKTALISDGVLQTLNVPAAAGQWLTAADQDPHGTRRLMISYGYWQRRFGGDPSAVGRSLLVDSRPIQIAGVMPRGFKLVNDDFDLLAPLALDPVKQNLSGFGFRSIARLRPGITLAQANADIARLINVWMDSWTNPGGADPHFFLRWQITPALQPLKDLVVGSVGSVLWVVMATIGMVMLIACTNIANLLLVRADARQQELAVRAALGAGRWRIARELLLESVTLGLLGGFVGIGVADAGLRLITAIGPGNLPRLNEISLDGWSLVFTLGLSVLSGLLFGLIPILRYAPAQQSRPLIGGMRTASAGRDRQRGRNLLVVAQVSMALVLLISAVLMVRSFQAMHNVRPGFYDPASLQVMSISIPGTVVSDPQTVTRLQNSIQDKLAAIPGVTSAGFTTNVPASGIEGAWDEIAIEGKDYQGAEPPIRVYDYVAPNYFHTAGTRIVAGRDFTWTDLYNLMPVGIVSENMARTEWGSAQAAIGKRFRELPFTPWYQVVGVVEDVLQNGVGQPAPAIVYWPSMVHSPWVPNEVQTMRTVNLVWSGSSRAGTPAFIDEVQHAVWSVNANLPVANITTLGEIYSDSMARTSFTLVMLGIAGTMALLLGVLGIYGVISYAVAQRTREIGIRVALGAKKGELVWIFVRSALTLVGIGAAIGLGAAAALMRLMRSVLFGISPLDPFTFAVVPLVLIVAATLASYLPARRTAAVDPMEALRAE